MYLFGGAGAGKASDRIILEDDVEVGGPHFNEILRRGNQPGPYSQRPASLDERAALHDPPLRSVLYASFFLHRWALGRPLAGALLVRSRPSSSQLWIIGGCTAGWDVNLTLPLNLTIASGQSLQVPLYTEKGLDPLLLDPSVHAAPAAAAAANAADVQEAAAGKEAGITSSAPRASASTTAVLSVLVAALLPQPGAGVP